ncbi:MAG TPA: molecular chaperone DnaJ [Caulobacteraceae bacterium]
MIILAVAGLALAILIYVGRGGRLFSVVRRLGPALIALAAAAGAVEAGLRGLWVVSVVLIALSIWFARDVGKLASRTRAAPPDRMQADEARAVLGVGPDAGRPEIEAAYRRLMLRAHPDVGGTSGLASRLNAARDRLIKKS